MQQENGGTSATIKDKEVKTGKRDIAEKDFGQSPEESSESQDKKGGEDDK